MPTVRDARDLTHFDKEVTGQALVESILPATSIQEIQQHDQTGAFDHFGPVIGSSASQSDQGQQQQKDAAGSSSNAAAEEEKKE